MKKLLFPILLSLFCFGTQAQNLSDALFAIEAEKYEQAGDMLRKLVAANPDDGRYNFHLGNLYMIIQEPEKAREAFEQGLSAKKNATINRVGIGRLMLDDGNIAGAESEFNLATQKLRKKDTEEYLYIAKAYLNSFNHDYEKAREYAQKVVDADPASAEGYLTLGDAHYNLGNMNDAYMAYRTAGEIDETKYRARLNMAAITKNARAFPEAARALEEITQIAPEYGPTYRELAEVYYLWGPADPDRYNEYIAKALDFYKQYMQLTDYSLDSRMRYADFLVLAKDYQSLQREAEEMQKIDNVNPRILRYLGYSAYENHNYEAAIDALTRFINSVDERRVLGIDYIYLAKSQFRLLMQDDTIDEAKMERMLANLSKAIELETPTGLSDFSAFAQQLYNEGRQDPVNYLRAAQIYQVLATAPQPDLMDLMLFGNSVLFAINSIPEDERANYTSLIENAEKAYAAVTDVAPTTYDAYYNTARINYIVPGREEQAIASFEKYINILLDAGETELAKATTIRKLAAAYANLGSLFLDTDERRAKELFLRSLEVDPSNEQARTGVDFLEGN